VATERDVRDVGGSTLIATVTNADRNVIAWSESPSPAPSDR
jgi:hypothetical protein